ncbi:hypothetical protein TNCV_114901 [Trichonephila clavipes]|nr:hypothetical protein TNCV_114901 [Trichonephila clavipes]
MKLKNNILCCCCLLCYLISTALDPRPRNSSWQVVTCTPAVALSTIQVTVRFSSAPPHFRGRTPWGGGQGSPTSLPLPPTSREDLRLDDYLEVLRHINQFL